MATAIKDGGPAFARPIGHNGYRDVEDHDSNNDQEGMSLRDYFAAKALIAVMVARTALIGDFNQESIAEECYELADALIEARTKEWKDA